MIDTLSTINSKEQSDNLSPGELEKAKEHLNSLKDEISKLKETKNDSTISTFLNDSKNSELRDKLSASLKMKKSWEISKAAAVHPEKENYSTVYIPKVSRSLCGHFGKVYAINWGGGRGGGAGGSLRKDKNNSETEFDPKVDLPPLVSASQDGRLIVWNAYTTYKIASIPLRNAWVMTCAIESNTNNLVASGGLDNCCSIYKVDNKSSTSSSVTASTTSDGGSSEGGGDGANSYMPISELLGHDGYIACTRFADSSKILTSSGDGTIMLWDVARGELLKTFEGHGGDVMSLDILPQINPNLFVSGSCDTTVKVWDRRCNSKSSDLSSSSLNSNDKGKENCSPNKSDQSVLTLHGHESDVNNVNLFPDGNLIASGSDDCTAQIFDIRSRSGLNVFSNEKVVSGVSSVSFSSSGRFLFAGYDDSNAICWDSLYNNGDTKDNNNLNEGYEPQNTPDFVYQLSGHTNKISCMGVIPNSGDCLATGSWDSTIKLWS